MTNKERDLIRLRTLKMGQSSYINWSEGGGGEVHRVNDVLVLFEVPLYGGNPQYTETYHIKEIHTLLDLAYTWT